MSVYYFPLITFHSLLLHYQYWMCIVGARFSRDGEQHSHDYWAWVAKAKQKKWRPGTCLSKRDKDLFHSYRERLKLLRACITSQEVAQRKAATPTKAIVSFPLLVSFPFIQLRNAWHIIHPRRLWLANLGPIGAPCITDIVTVPA